MNTETKRKDNPYKNLATKFESLQDNLQQLASVAVEAEHEDIGKRAQIALDKAQDRVFRVAIVGEFSTGKSTLINAMLGEELLPTALEACTAVVTTIRVAQADEETGVYVTFRMSGLRKIEPDELRSSLTFLGQEGDDLPVEAHVILPPGTFLDHGIESTGGRPRTSAADVPDREREKGRGTNRRWQRLVRFIAESTRSDRNRRATAANRS